MKQAPTIGPAAAWRDALGEGHFLLQRDRRSGEHVFPPRVATVRTAPDDCEWAEASGNGIIYAATVIHPRPPQPAYAVVLVDLEEGPRMMSRLNGVDPAEIRIGMPVRAEIATGDDGPMVVFRPG